MAEPKITEELRLKVMREMASRGGSNSRARLSQEESSRMGQTAVEARWDKFWRERAESLGISAEGRSREELRELARAAEAGKKP